MGKGLWSRLYKMVSLGFYSASIADAPEKQDLLDRWRANFIILTFNRMVGRESCVRTFNTIYDTPLK